MKNVIHILFCLCFAVSCSEPSEPSLFDFDVLVLFESSNDIIISNIDGTVKQNLTNSPEINEFDFDVSPLSSKIVFTRLNNSGEDLCVMDLDGKNIIVLMHSIGVGSPKFSHDGKQIVFVALPFGRAQIHTCKIDGTELKNISNNSYSDVSPQFSYDDQRIVFISSREPENGLFQMYKDGSKQAFITESLQSSYSISPIRDEIAFCKLDNEYRSDIYLTDFNGSNIMKLTTYDGWDDTPIFTSDGKKIIYLSNTVVENRPNGDIKSITVNTRIIENVVENFGSCYQPNITKNGDYLVFGKDKDLYIYSFKEKQSKNITNNSNGSYNPIIFQLN